MSVEEDYKAIDILKLSQEIYKDFDLLNEKIKLRDELVRSYIRELTNVGFEVGQIHYRKNNIHFKKNKEELI